MKKNVVDLQCYEMFIEEERERKQEHKKMIKEERSQEVNDFHKREKIRVAEFLLMTQRQLENTKVSYLNYSGELMLTQMGPPIDSDVVLDSFENSREDDDFYVYLQGILNPLSPLDL